MVPMYHQPAGPKGRGFQKRGKGKEVRVATAFHKRAGLGWGIRPPKSPIPAPACLHWPPLPLVTPDLCLCITHLPG